MQIKTLFAIFFIFFSYNTLASQYETFKSLYYNLNINITAGFSVGAGDYSALSRWTEEHNKAYHSYVLLNEPVYAGSTLSHPYQPNIVMSMDYTIELKIFIQNFGVGLSFGRGGFSSGENSFIIDNNRDTVNILRNSFMIYSYCVNYYYRYQINRNNRLYLIASIGIGYHAGTYSYSIVNSKYTSKPPYESQFETIYRGTAFSWTTAFGIKKDFNIISIDTMFRFRDGEISDMKAHNSHMRFENGSPVTVSIRCLEIVVNTGIHF